MTNHTRRTRSSEVREKKTLKRERRSEENEKNTITHHYTPYIKLTDASDWTDKDDRYGDEDDRSRSRSDGNAELISPPKTREEVEKEAAGRAIRDPTGEFVWLFRATLEMVWEIILSQERTLLYV